MKIDFSQFKPDDFLPILGTTCPALDQLQTGDLLFPRLSDAAGGGVSGSSTTKNLKTNVLEWWREHEPIRSVLGKETVAELIDKTNNPTLSQHRSLNLKTLKEELQRENDKKDATLANPSPAGFRLQKPDSVAPQTESTSIDVDSMLKDRRVIKLIIEILIASNFGELVKDWFNIDAPKTVSEFRKDPLIGLLFDLLSADDVRNEVFVGHVGIVICERDNIYIIEDNITSYSHYRVAIHPYYVKKDDVHVANYLAKNYNYTTLSYAPTTDFELPSNQATGWVNRRAAMLEHVWHARPKDLAGNDLISAAKALHGRPFGFFDHPKFGNNDRMYCAEYVYNAFKNGISPTMAKNLTDKMTWGDMEAYLKIVKNIKMLGFVQDILKDAKNKYKIKPKDAFFVLPPAMLWNSSGLHFPFAHPGGNPYAPIW